MTDSRPSVGLIVPPAHGRVPGHGPDMYANLLTFVAAGLGLEAMSIEGYDAVIDRVGDLASELRDRGAGVIVLMGTSLSFYRGVAFDQELIHRMEQASGLPATTMSQAIVAGLRAVGAKRLAVATAYTDEVNDRLRDYMAAAGFTISSLEGLGVVDTGSAQVVPLEEIRQVSGRALATARDIGEPVDALLISCGALDTLTLLPELEHTYGVPVVASSPAGFWAAARLAGVDPRIDGAGALLGTNHEQLR